MDDHRTSEGEPAPDPTRDLAVTVLEMRYEELSARDREQLTILAFDHLSVARCGAEARWSQAVQDYARQFASAEGCRVLGTRLRVPPAIAALANATAAHGLELDDTHDASVSHPGAPIIAATLALAERYGSSGADIASSIAAGYEVVGRIGAATQAGGVIERGFHPTALFCGFGVVAAAARLLHFDSDALVRAWGLQLSAAGGSMQFSCDAAGTAVKRLHGGYAAHNGITAAELARRGIAGPGHAFDGRYGLCRLFGVEPRFDRLYKGGGEPLELQRISLKPYPCCRLFHSTIDALRDVTEAFQVAPGKIRRVVVGGPNIMVSQHMLRRPTSEMAAQYSLPFTLGAAMHYGPESVEGFAATALSSPAVLDFADRVEARADAELEAAFPEHFGSWVEIELDSGERRRADVLDSRGTPANPMDIDAVQRKYELLCGGFVDAPSAPDLLAAVRNLWIGGTVDDVLDALCGPAGA